MKTKQRQRIIEDFESGRSVWEMALELSDSTLDKKKYLRAGKCVDVICGIVLEHIETSYKPRIPSLKPTRRKAKND